MISTAHRDILLEPPEFSLVTWLDEMTMDESAPKYLIPSQRRRGQLDEADCSELVGKIGDLGGGRAASIYIFI
jgi:serine/threonine-protein kinase SRPK3